MAVLFTPDEAAKIQIESLRDPASSGLGALEVPPALKSKNTFFRIRVTMLEAMGSAQPGRTLDMARADFINSFKGVINLSTLTLFKAEWDYLATMRNAMYESLQRVLVAPPQRRKFEVASLLRAFVEPYHKRRERVDFGLFRAFICGYTDQTTLDWLNEIWNAFQLDKPQTFLRRLVTSRNLFRSNDQ